MSPRSKRRGWPVPDAANIAHLIYEIEKVLVHEDNCKPDLLVISCDEKPGQVNLFDRDGAVHILRCLKVWFDLPSRVFLTAVNFLDRFLTKMKVQQKFLACATVSCFYLAAKVHNCKIEPWSLVTVSQSKCSARDMERMSDIIEKKLAVEPNNETITTYNYLNLFLEVFESVATRLGIKSLLSIILKKDVLLTRLEVVMCNSSCAYERPTVITIGLIQAEIERFLADEIPGKSPHFSIEMLKLITTLVDLKCICTMVPEEFVNCHSKIVNILKEYDNHSKFHHRQHLEWRYSSRTLNTPKPSQNYYFTLPAVREE